MKIRTYSRQLATATALLALASGPSAADPARGTGEESWEVRHPAQGFEAEFSAAGIHVRGTGRSGAPWRLGLRLAAWGRGDDLRTASEGTVSRHDDRFEIHRGSLIEWYVNDERGVEQGFTLTSPPDAKLDDQPLRLVLAVEGGFACEVLEGERDARFTRKDLGASVSYTGLRAWDAAGRELPARFSHDDGRLSMLVDDEGATYPLVVDPWIWTQQAKLAASDAASMDFFGHSVSLSGSTALVGAHEDDDRGSNSGSAYVFVQSGTNWYQQAKLNAADGVSLDEFGYSVAIDGDTAVIGAIGDDDGGSRSGSAYVFARSGVVWIQQAKLTASDAAADDGFGSAAAIDGDTVVISAEGDDAAKGAAYVFVRSGSNWSQQAKLTAGDGSGSDRFGESVAISGNTVLVGAFYDDGKCGSAYVFTRSGTTWTQQAKLVASDRAAEDYFGVSVSIDGNTTLIGAEEDDYMGSDSGSAYVFERTGTSWSQTAKFTGSDIDAEDRFGCSVAVEGNLALVGADHDDGVGMWNGSAYAFHRAGGIWSETAKLSASDEVWGESFGNAVSLSVPYALIGSALDDDAGTNSGTAFVFLGTALASATHRNAGTNPDSYTAVTLPILGTQYTAAIDVGGTSGHSLAWLGGFTTPLTLTLGGGQTMLINAFDPRGELLHQRPSAGPIATYYIPIPPYLSLMGFELSTQAVHVGGVQPFALSNAQDLVVGY